ncbi:MAG: class I tRNA ligase family protein, partial [Xenococcus sp. (in: cyanobacteria)]
ATLAHVLEGTLKLLHPLMPHITEEIWQTLTKAEGKETLALQSYPEVASNLIQPELETSFELLFGVIRTIRNLRVEASVKPGLKINVIVQTESEAEIASLQPVTDYIENIAKLEQLTIIKNLEEDPGQVIVGVFGTIQVIVPLMGMVDIAALRSKLEKNLAKVEKEIKSLTGRLNNPGFVNKAPADVIQAAKDALAEAETQAEILRDRLNRLQ